MRIFYDKKKSLELMERIEKRFGKRVEKTARGQECHVSDVIGCEAKVYCRMKGFPRKLTKQAIGLMVFGIIAQKVLQWTYPKEWTEYESTIDAISEKETVFGHIDVHEELKYPLEAKASRKKVFKRSQIPDYWLKQLICYDEKTEVLTRDGFKFFKDITFDDKIATLNPKTNELEYNFPTAIQRFSYKGKMIHFGGGRCRYDFLVTPEHNMFVKKQYDGKFSFYSAEDLLKYYLPNWSFKKDAKWQGKNPKFFYIPIPESLRPNLQIIEKVSIKNFLEFLGWYLSEGSLSINKRSSHIVRISQKNHFYLKEIINCAEKLGFHVNIQKDGINIFSKQLYKLLEKYGHYSHERFIPIWVKELNPELLKILLNSLWKGDGSFKDGQMTNYTTTSKRLADDIMELLLKIGLSSSCGTYFKKSRRTQYVISVNYSQLTPRITKIPTKQFYSGYVYDVTVPNHIIYVRRNGKVCWSGNCYMAMEGADKGWIVIFNVFSCQIMAFQVQMTASERLAQLTLMTSKATRIKKAVKKNNPNILEIDPTNHQYCAYRNSCPRVKECYEKWKEMKKKKKKSPLD